MVIIGLEVPSSNLLQKVRSEFQVSDGGERRVRVGGRRRRRRRRRRRQKGRGQHRERCHDQGSLQLLPICLGPLINDLRAWVRSPELSHINRKNGLGPKVLMESTNQVLY